MRKTFKIAPEDWTALNQLRGRPAAQRLYWARMGQRMGFDPESVLPTHSLTSFTALPPGHGKEWCFPYPLKCKRKPMMLEAVK